MTIEDFDLATSGKTDRLAVGQKMIRLAIIDNNRLESELIASFFNNTHGAKVANYCSCAVVGKLATDQRADVVLINGPVAGRDIFAELPVLLEKLGNPKVMIMSSAFSRQDIVDGLTHGVSGFFDKTQGIDELSLAIRYVMHGRTFLPYDLMPLTAPKKSSVFTDRQQEVLTRIAAGATNKAIARELGLSEACIKQHARSIMRILGVNNRTQIAIKAANQNLI